ncbi:MAG: large protein, partial [Bacteroidota bacterium]|nr:large protein [Bacteroidota bacterium]
GYTYLWNFGDGSGSTGTSTTHTYATSNYYQLCLVTTDAATGCADSQCHNLFFDHCGIGQASINVSSNGLSADFNVNIFPFGGGSGLTYLWDFPGGSPSSATTQIASSTYSTLGAKTVSLGITLSGCTDTISQTFTLTPPVYSISGIIYKNGSRACATVYLIRQDTIGHLVLIDSIAELDTIGNCNGYYAFNNLPADSYFVKAALEPFDADYLNYLPTYFADVLQWSSSAPIWLNTSSASGIDINLVAGNNPGGPGFVGGWVSQGAGLVINGHYNNNRSVGDPIAGVQINLLTSADQAVAYTFTDANGHYQFAHLSLGSYKIYAEVLNKRADPIPFTLDANNPSDSTVSLSVNSSGVSGIDEVNAINLNNIYPNPVTSVLNLEIGCATSTNATLKLNDVLGQASIEKEIKLVSGNNQMQIDMSELSAGIYQLVIQTGSKNIAFKVVKTK